MTRLEKCLTGIAGFDEMTNGGVPRGRPTIVCGGPGCGKTMFALEFLVRGATEFNEPGVLMTFEETSEEMSKNVASLGFDLQKLAAKKKLVLEYVRIEPAEIQETGEYDLEGLFIRLQHAVKTIGAKRVVLDTLEAIFSGFSNTGMLRAEIRRLFRWLKDRGLTTVVTAEKLYEGNLFDDPTLAAGALGGFYVQAIAVVPNGAWPLALADHYAADAAHLSEYARMAASAEGFAAYLDRHVHAQRAA